jgi:hypothetical protein
MPCAAAGNRWLQMLIMALQAVFMAACAEDGPPGVSENNSLTRREFGTALFKEEARLSKHDFISVPQGDAFAWALRD